MHHLARCSICCLALMTTASFTGGEENRPQGDKAPQAERGGPAVVERLLEAVAERRGNKVRRFRLSDAHKVPCPQTAGLIYSSGSGIGLIIPNFVLNNGVLLPGESKDLKTITFIFGTLQCRFSISAKKFVMRDGVEVEVPLSEPYERPSPVVPRPENRPSQLPPGVEIRGNQVDISPKGIDPDLIGTMEMWRGFASPEPKLNFSGMVWFGPKNFSLYLGNVADLSLTSQTNVDNKALEIDLTNATGRIRISVRKEVLVGNSWIAELNE